MLNLTTILYEDYERHPERYRLPIAVEALKAGDVVTIRAGVDADFNIVDYIVQRADAQIPYADGITIGEIAAKSPAIVFASMAASFKVNMEYYLTPDDAGLVPDVEPIVKPPATKIYVIEEGGGE